MISPIPPFKDKVLSSDDTRALKEFYQQFYGQQLIDISCFCVVFGKVPLAGDLIGSVLPGANNWKSSVIMANWSGSEDMFLVGSNGLRIGEVQYFLKHVIAIERGGSRRENIEHVFAYVYWKKQHSNESWFGTSAVVCTDLFDLNMNPFLPVQRIANRCAHATLKVKLDSYTHNSYVVCPIPVKYCI